MGVTAKLFLYEQNKLFPRKWIVESLAAPIIGHIFMDEKQLYFGKKPKGWTRSELNRTGLWTEIP